MLSYSNRGVIIFCACVSFPCLIVFTSCLSDLNISDKGRMTSVGSADITRLFVEEDIIRRVFLQLDYKTLWALELTCRLFRQSVMQAFIWKKKFETENQSYMNKTMDVDKRFKIDKYFYHHENQDSHRIYKKLVSRLYTLDQNLKKGKSDKMKLKGVASHHGDTSDYLRGCRQVALKSDNYFFYGNEMEEDLLNEQVKVLNIGQDKVKEVNINVGGGDEDFFVVHADSLPVSSFSSKFGNIALLYRFYDTAGEFVLETFTYDKRSDGYISEYKSPRYDTGDDVVTVKFVSPTRLMVLGAKGIDAFVSILSVEDGELKLTETKICSGAMVVDHRGEMDSDAIDKCSLKDDYLVISKLDSYVGIYDLKTTNSTVEALWEKEVITKVSIPKIRCSAVELSFPNLFVGRTDGRCDVFNIEKRLHVRTLEHKLDSGLNMAVIKLRYCNDYLFSLTESGWLFAWDKIKAGSPAEEGEIMLWESHSKHMKKVTNFAVNNTEIVTIEEKTRKNGVGVKEYLVKRDFWVVKDKKEKKRKKIPEDKSSTRKRSKDSKEVKSRQIKNRIDSDSDDDHIGLIDMSDDYDYQEWDDNLYS